MNKWIGVVILGILAIGFNIAMYLFTKHKPMSEGKSDAYGIVIGFIGIILMTLMFLNGGYLNG